MSIIHVRQIEAKLRALFTNLIDLSDYVGKPKIEQDSAFLTRALAAFAILVTADITPDQAALCITDGFHDNGIDAVYFDSREKVLFVVQTKWKHDGTGSIERGDALKFITGVKDLINAEFDRFNDKIKNRSVEILDALSLANTRIVLLAAYTGQATLSQEVLRDFRDFLNDMNDPSEVVELRVLRQGNLHGIVASGTLGAPINFDVVLKDWGQIREHFLRITVLYRQLKLLIGGINIPQNFSCRTYVLFLVKQKLTRVLLVLYYQNRKSSGTSIMA